LTGTSKYEIVRTPDPLKPSLSVGIPKTRLGYELVAKRGPFLERQAPYKRTVEENHLTGDLKILRRGGGKDEEGLFLPR